MKKEKAIINTISGVELLKESFIEYSIEVNEKRAFNFLLSGLKPSYAHILWSMYVNNRLFNRNYTKSAKVDGEVMNYNPHGQNYGTMVRLSQPFVHHVPFIDGHGSFGSVVGGPDPASSRYTEMRMSEFAQDVLFYNTKLLDMGLNYLEEDPEPILNTWVALLPLLYMSNSAGMGYTMSNAWSSGNLYEFKEQLENYLKTGKVDCSKLYPDFPTGGIIINKSEMKELYETGKGTIKLRGNYTIEDNLIRVTSLPYQVYPADFMESLKKFVTSNEHYITDIANRCDKNGINIEIECQDGMAEYTIEQLCRKTNFQVNISNERKAIGAKGRPEIITMLEYMKTFVESNLNLVIKEAKLNLENINARLEIVDGLISALDMIDTIISCIKKSKSIDASKKKIIELGFTENQAQAIVSMRLGRLANLEQIKLKDEKKELEQSKEFNQSLIDNKNARTKYFLDRFNSLVDKYGWDRRTEVIDLDTSTIIKETKTKIVKPRVKKEFMVVLTENNCLKKIDIGKFKKTQEDEKTIKVKQGEKVVLVAKSGQMYKAVSNKIDKCLPTAAGMNISSLGIEDEIINIYANDKISGKEECNFENVFFITNQGLGKKSNIQKSLGASKSTGVTVMGLKKENDFVVGAKLVNDTDSIKVTTNMREIILNVKDYKVSGRGASGSNVCKLKNNEEILSVESIVK